MEFEVLPGTPGLTLASVAHVLIPGYGRLADATALTLGGTDRCRTGLALHRSLGRGVVVCSGYKSPSDHTGTPRVIDGRSYQGVPEADLMRSWMVGAGADPGLVRAERDSVDTVTNLLRSDTCFGDSRPIAIVSHRGHLRRILSVIAPRTLRRSYLGVVVPGDPLHEKPIISVMSWLTTVGLPPSPDRAIAAATRRSELMWKLSRFL
ncbi:ElyC/SanA/YdcF family protein [Actinoplanes couchii]|uniref:DUF218 domain-containing protein n=1 Tax=Actinoplanes couchii TaxID=403638 RepID=A0ABQ3X3J3_9ACTN|nr:ElyC/SanA/YdcF family protein [Actinoplanes couchii]MDR6322802.1 hypothetical protein [Actinoplanes couchii]GID53042.1 hypothetical protein Aco03nite_014460 [Actinoplanes couchii]